MINKILIANRGEVAIRVIRACREMGIKTVAVYSEIDKDSLHVALADESVCIGPAPSNESYLNIKNIIEAACLTNSDAIHPGFGFLSENSKFAKICEETNIIFIGPKYELIDLMGNKSKAKETMRDIGVPTVPGSDGCVETLKQAIDVSKKIGYPVMMKASAGGGGKGIRLLNSEEELKKSYDIVKTEAKNSFNDDSIYIEKFVKNPRHVEIQVLADAHGNVIHLGERDCSIQRRHQKIIEESPSTVLTTKLRAKMGDVGVKAVKAVGYTNAGTIEFLVDKNKDFYFMEMNTRLQVEHPVTEMVTDVDIVKEQIRIANGGKLTYKQSDVWFRGHSIECRINAEDPSKNFMPCPGKIDDLHLPGGKGVRIDTGIYSGYTIPHTYDSMIAKLVVHDVTRVDAINKMRCALSEIVIGGINTNVDFLIKILSNENYVNGEYDTSFIEKEEV